MSSHVDEDNIKTPGTVPADADEAGWEQPDEAPTRGGFGNGHEGYGSSLPTAYTELHGDVRKGQKPPTERD